MDEGKVETIWNWPTPSTIKEFQRFLGFTNFSVHPRLQFHHQPTHQSPEKKVSVLVTSCQRSSPTAEDIHQRTAPHPPRPRETVHCGGGCLHHRGRNGVIPAAGDSSQTPSMCLLLCSYSLPGCALHSQVLHLQYLKEANRLNHRQARWALFFTRFNFSISYRPCSKNVKVDALSRLYAPEEVSEEPEPILPPELIVSPIQ
jgi:hypothetical protein